GGLPRRIFSRVFLGVVAGLAALSQGVIANGGITENPPTWAPIEFPNFGHRYWENYRLTGEFYVAR
ncbi:MAG TPA: hypothetical protein PLM37_04700, partial [Elusimicrobiota bacterium]|nr:hypothetical protein [Elusimicrobiota bacterium]